MRKLLTYIFIVFIFGAQAQELHHQMLSAQGTSKELFNGIYVSQTIGQQSVIGNYTKDGKTYGQGFQQSLWNRYIGSNSNNSITTVVYPNPFVSTINFQFSQPVQGPISVNLFDVRGRLIFTTEKEATESTLTLDLPHIADSNYLVRLSTPNYTYYAQILKKQ
ncbi:T9SS type A sorting domain-containing protein [Flavobacterium sp.]|jgi:hypothetical protein|uniref:T9SS type A sorting domain-containing protein n=1 Tax=Flavobacterium sp. TaxID=239 RepID=UPI0037BE31B0